MGINNFSRRQCVKALKKLGFQLADNRRGSHDKYQTPNNLINSSLYSFIMVPRHNNLRCQNAIIKELRAIGGDELIRQFREYL